MPYDPGVSDFIPFHGLVLDSSKRAQCIFLTQKGNRCRHERSQSDTTQAISLHRDITSMSSEAVDLDQLEDFILYNCCNQAAHRKRMERTGLLTPLAQRWQNEIRTHFNRTTSIPEPRGTVVNNVDYTTLSTPSQKNTTARRSSIQNPDYDQLNESRSSSMTPTPYQTSRSSSHSQHGSSPWNGTVDTSLSGNQSRHNLRSRNISENSTSVHTSSIPPSPRSGFRPHIENPRPHDSVFHKIQSSIKLGSQDDKTGSLYIFNKASSHGHVKIGWTSSSVEGRLTAWAKCGYKPNLLFRVDCIPHARRVETLVHYELMKEWRRERMCQGCGKSHQEWFEVDAGWAGQVVNDWANFMRTAEPYDANGHLKLHWLEVVRNFHNNGELVTAKKLLEHHEAIKQRERIEEIRKIVDTLCSAFAARSAAFDSSGFYHSNTLIRNVSNVGAPPAVGATVRA